MKRLEEIDFATAEARGLVPQPAVLLLSTPEGPELPGNLPPEIIAMIPGQKYKIMGGNIEHMAVNYCTPQPPKDLVLQYGMQKMQITTPGGSAAVRELFTNPEKNAPGGFEFLRQEGSVLFYLASGTEVVIESHPPYNEVGTSNLPRKGMQALRRHFGEMK